MDYWVLAQRQSLEYLLARYPDDTLRVFPTSHSALILPRNDRERITFAPPHEADFHLKQRVNRRNAGEPPAFHAIRAYDSGIAFIIDPAAADYLAYHSAAYDDVAANGTLLARSDFDIYIYDGAIYYLSANCAPPTPKTSDLWMFLHIFSADPDNPPQHKRTRGFVNHGFPFGTDAAFFDGKCVVGSLLPDDYPIARIRTGQDATESGVKAWRVDIGLAALAAADYLAYHRAAYQDVAANGTLLARSDFDIYIYDGAIYYISANCAPPTPKTSTSRMFLHIFSADPDNPPQHKRTRGFVNHGFPFGTDAAFFDGKCVAGSPLPADYPIARIRTGQDATQSGVKAWRVDIGLAARAAAQAAYKRIAAGDYGSPAAQSQFDLYLRGDTLIYLKEPCAEGDFDERFFLHIIPADLADLPADRRDAGYANLDFRFVDHGADIGGKCVGLRDLPGYAIERIRTGQFVSGEGALWRVEFAADP